MEKDIVVDWPGQKGVGAGWIAFRFLFMADAGAFQAVPGIDDESQTGSFF